MKFLVLSALLVTGAFAQKNDLSHRPKSFAVSGGKAVFTDWQTADYDIVYDGAAKKASVTATIKFYAPEGGLPVFDLVAEPTSVVLNGETVTAPEIKTPSNETTVRVISKAVAPGSHTLVVTAPLTELVDFKDGGVRSAFWTSDLDERNFLERYLPSSLEYDQVKMTFALTFQGFKAKQKIYTNGSLKENGSKVTISYPAHFNTSSLFFHTVPEGAVDEVRFSLRSIDGREIPAVVYAQRSIWGGGSSLTSLRDKTIRIFAELEGDYGAWPHPQVIIYNAGSGGMEYCGATMTDAWALGHELFHSYFARGVMPANGNAGWLDEALASWRDDGYTRETSLSGSSRMSSHPYYERTTDRAAYSFGARFMSYMDGRLAEKGGLKPFMRYMVENRKFAPLFVEDFIQEMTAFTGIKVETDFRKYTFGSANNFSDDLKSSSRVHRKMTLKELKQYL